MTAGSADCSTLTSSQTSSGNITVTVLAYRQNSTFCLLLCDYGNSNTVVIMPVPTYMGKGGNMISSCVVCVSVTALLSG